MRFAINYWYSSFTLDSLVNGIINVTFSDNCCKQKKLNDSRAGWLTSRLSNRRDWWTRCRSRLRFEHRIEVLLISQTAMNVVCLFFLLILKRYFAVDLCLLLATWWVFARSLILAVLFNDPFQFTARFILGGFDARSRNVPVSRCNFALSTRVKEAHNLHL